MGMTASRATHIFKVLCWNFPLLPSQIPNYEQPKCFSFLKNNNNKKNYFSVLHLKLESGKACDFSNLEEQELTGYPERAPDSSWLDGSELPIVPSLQSLVNANLRAEGWDPGPHAALITFL